jgi:hypothetical protein
MPRSRVVHGAIGASLLLASCGGGNEHPVDAGPCWPLNAKPGGQVELGTGDVVFEPMPDVLPIINNLSQSDPYLQVHARIHGLSPGNPDDILDSHNPRTKVSAVIADLGLTLDGECPASLGYIASPEPGAFDLSPHSIRLGFGSFPPDQASGKQARITIEVVSNGRSAQAEKLVTLTTMPADSARASVNEAP